MSSTAASNVRASSMPRFAARLASSLPSTGSRIRSYIVSLFGVRSLQYTDDRGDGRRSLVASGVPLRERRQRGPRCEIAFFSSVLISAIVWPLYSKIGS